MFTSKFKLGLNKMKTRMRARLNHTRARFATGFSRNSKKVKNFRKIVQNIKYLNSHNSNTFNRLKRARNAIQFNNPQPNDPSHLVHETQQLLRVAGIHERRQRVNLTFDKYAKKLWELHEKDMSISLENVMNSVFQSVQSSANHDYIEKVNVYMSDFELNFMKFKYQILMIYGILKNIIDFKNGNGNKLTLEKFNLWIKGYDPDNYNQWMHENDKIERQFYSFIVMFIKQKTGTSIDNLELELFETFIEESNVPFIHLSNYLLSTDEDFYIPTSYDKLPKHDVWKRIFSVACYVFYMSFEIGGETYDIIRQIKYLSNVTVTKHNIVGLLKHVFEQLLALHQLKNKLIELTRKEIDEQPHNLSRTDMPENVRDVTNDNLLYRRLASLGNHMMHSLVKYSVQSHTMLLWHDGRLKFKSDPELYLSNEIMMRNELKYIKMIFKIDAIKYNS
jgi:hypothetical protein